MNSFEKNSTNIKILLLILSLGGLLNFSLEVAKIALFNETNGELKLSPMDYVYLTALILGVSGYWCCHVTESDGNYNNYRSCGSIVSLIILILYTVYTKNEMGDIPFFCPADYPYSSHLIRTACQVRAANLLIMWVCPALSLLILIILLIVVCYYINENENDIKDIEKQPL